MKNDSCKNNKLNNKGFSLVEVLVAVIILALVAGPILMAFVMSARFNARARETQRVSAVAESVMEEFKGMSIADARVAYATAPDALVFDRKDFVVEAGSLYYDVKITATPYEDPRKSATAEVVKPSLINPSTDYVFTQDMYQDKTVYDSILTEVYNYIDGVAHISASHPEITPSHLKSSITVKRYITLTVNGDDSTQNARVDIKYTYEVAAYAVGGTVVPAHSFADIEFPGTDKTYTDLSSVYLFYSPGYSSLAASGVAKINGDYITIKNNTSREITGFVVKQENPLYGLNVVSCENEYFPNISYEGVTPQQYAVAADSLSNFNAHVDENLMYKLSVQVYADGSYEAGFPGAPLYELKGTINSDRDE